LTRISFYIPKAVISRTEQSIFKKNGFNEKRKGFEISLEENKHGRILFPEGLKKFYNKGKITLMEDEIREKDKTVIVCSLRGERLTPFYIGKLGKFAKFSMKSFCKITLLNYEDLLYIKRYVLREQNNKYIIEKEVLYEGGASIPSSLFMYQNAVDATIAKKINPMHNFFIIKSN